MARVIKLLLCVVAKEKHFLLVFVCTVMSMVYLMFLISTFLHPNNVIKSRLETKPWLHFSLLIDMSMLISTLYSVLYADATFGNMVYLVWTHQFASTAAHIS